MDEMKHTKGPWAVNPLNAQVDAFGPHPQPICQLLWPTDVRSEAETEANAKVIAAAPEMLEALLAIQEVADAQLKSGDETVTLGHFGSYMRNLRDVIRKATGAPTP